MILFTALFIHSSEYNLNAPLKGMDQKGRGHSFYETLHHPRNHGNYAAVEENVLDILTNKKNNVNKEGTVFTT